jgi:hypothetical protein
MANRYAKTGNRNWNIATAWSATSSAGTDNAGIPTVNDDVIFDTGATGTMTVNATTCVAKTITCMSANNKIALGTNRKLSLYGNMTLFANMTLSGTSPIWFNADATIKSAGKTIPNLQIDTANITLNGNLTATTFHGLQDLVLNGYQLSSNNFTMDYSISGTTNVVMIGSNGVLGISTTMSNNLTFNCNDCSVYDLYYSTGTITYTAGAISPGGLYIAGDSALDTNGMTWTSINPYNIITNITLSSDFQATTITIGFIVGLLYYTVAGAYTITCDSLDAEFDAVSQPLIRFEAGTTIVVNSNLIISGTGQFTIPFQSSSAGSEIYLDYLGTPGDCFVARGEFTDVDASGSAQAIDNWYGGTLTRCTNIINRTSADIGGSTSDVFGII